MLAGCRQQVQDDASAISFVKDQLSDDGSLLSRMSPLYRSVGSRGSIYVVGESSRVLAMGDEFLAADWYNNVSGRRRDDLLPDFSGEVISLVLDSANAPYGGYVSAGNEEYLRELTVRNVLSVLDTVCYVSPYDREGLGAKRMPKMIVLASSYAPAYGKADVDSLFRAAGINVPVITPYGAMLSKLFDGTKGDLIVGVMSTGEDLFAGLYSSVFQREARRNGRNASECVVFSAKGENGFLKRFADNYAAAGYTRPMDALLVDDVNVDPDALRAEYEELVSVHNPHSLTYGRIFNDGFRIIDCRRALTDACYAALRSRNNFANRIAYPQIEKYLTVPLTDDDKYSRSPGQKDAATYMLIQYSDRYYTEEDVQD